MENMEIERAEDRAPVHPKLPKKLTPHEVALFKRAEKTIERGFVAFHQMGEALKLIRSQRLYRLQWPDFEAYCINRWGFRAARARQIIGAAEVYAEIEDAVEVKPVNEFQVRPLRRLPRELKIEAWNEATLVAPRPSREIVESAIERVMARHTEPETVIEAEPVYHHEPETRVVPQEMEYVPDPLAAMTDEIMEMTERHLDLLTSSPRDYDAIYTSDQTLFLRLKDHQRAIEHMRLASAN